MRIIIIFRIGTDYYLLSDNQARIKTYPQLWVAHQEFLTLYRNTFGKAFEYYEGIPKSKVPLRPSLCVMSGAKEVRRELIPAHPKLLIIKGDEHCMYGVTARAKGARYWEAGRKDKFNWLELEIKRKKEHKQLEERRRYAGRNKRGKAERCCGQSDAC